MADEGGRVHLEPVRHQPLHANNRVRPGHIGRDVLPQADLQVEEGTDHPAVECLDLQRFQRSVDDPVALDLPPELAGIGADPALEIQEVAFPRRRRCAPLGGRPGRT